MPAASGHGSLEASRSRSLCRSSWRTRSGQSLREMSVRRWRLTLVLGLAFAALSVLIVLSAHPRRQPVSALSLRDPSLARRTRRRRPCAALLGLVPRVPTLVWGRDQLGTGDMWNSNSVISWLVARSGIDTARIHPPAGGRAPGWQAGLALARRPDPEGAGTRHGLVARSGSPACRGFSLPGLGA